MQVMSRSNRFFNAGTSWEGKMMTLNMTLGAYTLGSSRKRRGRYFTAETSDIFSTPVNYVRIFKKMITENHIFVTVFFPPPPQLDYASTHQLLHERSITLHILMDQDFTYEKARLSKIFYGMDRDHAYTKKDAAVLKGDKDLRSQARISKTSIGICAPLALETNGTVFTSKKMDGDKGTNVKKFIGVYSKRLARSTASKTCQTCECSSDDDGNAYFECYTCHDAVSSNFGDSVSVRDEGRRGAIFCLFFFVFLQNFPDLDAVYSDETTAEDFYDSEED